MVSAYSLRGKFQRLALCRRQRVQRLLQRLVRQFEFSEAAHVKPVKTPGVVKHGGIATCPDVGKDGGDGLVDAFILRGLKGQQGVKAGGEIGVTAGKAFDVHEPTTLAKASRIGSIFSRLSFSAA